MEENGAVLEGGVDLLYREPGGDYVVMDYKRDMALPKLGLEAYRQLMALYAGQLKRITGRRVREVVLVCYQPTARWLMRHAHVGH